MFPEPETLSTSDGQIRVESGQTLYLLTYEGEGYTTAWFQGRLHRGVDGGRIFNGACDLDPTLCRGTIVEPWQSVWWVQIRNSRGQVGWTNEPAKFANKDALG
jgi:hypothetical protein